MDNQRLLESFAANYRKCICAILSLVVAISLIPGTLGAQETESPLNELAKKMADALAKADVHSVAVFDFAGQGRKVSALGQDFAEKFGLALQKESASLSVVSRTFVQTTIEDNRLAPAVVRNTEIASWLASQLKVDAFIVGSLLPLNDQLSVGVQSIQVKTQKEIAEFTVSVPFSADMRTLLGLFVGSKQELDTKTIILDKGTIPRCIHCPSPPYTHAARDAGIQGTVILSVLVGLDGRARDIDVLKSLSYGLDVETIKAVKAWVFAPGKAADGKNLEVEIPIEATFR